MKLPGGGYQLDSNGSGPINPPKSGSGVVRPKIGKKRGKTLTLGVLQWEAVCSALRAAGEDFLAESIEVVPDGSSAYDCGATVQDDAALVAFDHAGVGALIEFRGEGLQRVCDEYGLTELEDHTQPAGLHVWSGSVNFPDPDRYSLDGTWRRVTPHEAHRWALSGLPPWRVSNERIPEKETAPKYDTPGNRPVRVDLAPPQDESAKHRNYHAVSGRPTTCPKCGRHACNCGGSGHRDVKPENSE